MTWMNTGPLRGLFYCTPLQNGGMCSFKSLGVFCCRFSYFKMKYKVVISMIVWNVCLETWKIWFNLTRICLFEMDWNHQLVGCPKDLWPNLDQDTLKVLCWLILAYSRMGIMYLTQQSQITSAIGVCPLNQRPWAENLRFLGSLRGKKVSHLVLESWFWYKAILKGWFSLQETNISHLGKRNIIDSNMPWDGIC